MHALLDLFQATAENQADRLAVADQSLMLRYRELPPIAMGLALQIAAASQRPRIGVLAPTSAAAATAILACWYAGRTPVPLNFLLSPGELGPVLADADLDLVVTIDRFAESLQAGAASVGRVISPLLLNGKTLVPGRVATPSAAPDATGVVLYTSGTLGAPKGVCLTFANLVSNARAAIEHAEMHADQVMLSVLPQFHSFGFTALTVTPLLLGATVHYLPRFSPVALLETMREKAVTVFMAVPSMYGALLSLKSAPADAASRLELAISGGEPLPASVADGVRARFGIELCEGYGLTETSPIVSLNTRRHRRPGSVGRPLPGVEVATVDDQRRSLPPGAEGEIVVRGHCVMHGYHNRPADTSAVLQGGTFFTGDIGRVDADGFIYITGRAKEMMIVAGENVFPREIENVLLEHPAVAEAAVIGVRDDLRGELPAAFAILKAGASATEADLRAFCRDRLAGYKIPRSITFATDLPRGPTGKILKRALKAP